MIERVFAALGLLVCVALALQMLVPVRRQARLIAWARDPFGLRARRKARAAADDAIRRAQRHKRWKGNVYQLGSRGSAQEGRDHDGDEPPRTLH